MGPLVGFRKKEENVLDLYEIGMIFGIVYMTWALHAIVWQLSDVFQNAFFIVYILWNLWKKLNQQFKQKYVYVCMCVCLVCKELSLSEAMVHIVNLKCNITVINNWISLSISRNIFIDD